MTEMVARYGDIFARYRSVVEANLGLYLRSEPSALSAKKTANARDRYTVAVPRSTHTNNPHK